MMKTQFDAIILDCYGVILTPRFPMTKDCLIPDTVSFIQNCETPLYVASSAETSGLKALLTQLEIAEYFKGICGGPIAKSEHIHTILLANNYSPTNTILIGDSVTDLDAAKESGIQFAGYNNLQLSQLAPYLATFSELK